jgi:disulfide bond formation protein DsbB
MPGFRLALCAVAGFPLIAVALRHGRRDAFLAFGASGLLSAIILPFKSVAAAYILFFGAYPILKSYFETKRLKTILQFIVKFAYFNITFLFGAWLLQKAGLIAQNASGILSEYLAALGVSLPQQALIAAGFAVVNLVFLLYDIGLTRLITTFLSRTKK